MAQNAKKAQCGPVGEGATADVRFRG